MEPFSRVALALPWVALVAAFSPVVADWIRFVATSAEARYVALFPVLWGLAARRSERSEPRKGGYALVAMGLVLELLGILADTRAVARLGLPLAIVGLARAQGLVPLRVGLLAFWWVPVPIAVVSATSPQLESLQADIAARVVGALGAEVEPRGPYFLGPPGRLDLVPGDGGPLLVWILAGIGWYRHARRPVGFVSTALGALCWGALAVVLQPLAVVLALVVYAVGAPDAARLALSTLPWLLPAALAIYWSEFGGATGSPSTSR